jgi:hypothetical protein
MLAILTGVRWDLKVVLICISFMARDGEHFSRVFLATWLLPLKKLCSAHLPIREKRNARVTVEYTLINIKRVL